MCIESYKIKQEKSIEAMQREKVNEASEINLTTGEEMSRFVFSTLYRPSIGAAIVWAVHGTYPLISP